MMSSDSQILPIPSDLPEKSREELSQRLRSSSITVVDVLPEESYAASHIPGALNLPVEEIASRARDSVPKLNAEIAVFSRKFT
jgi:rhodanese-related sulfurtransferase